MRNKHDQGDINNLGEGNCSSGWSHFAMPILYDLVQEMFLILVYVVRVYTYDCLSFKHRRYFQIAWDNHDKLT